MGVVITVKASVGRIEDHVRRTLRGALARGGEVGRAADSRLSAAVAAIDATIAPREATAAAAATAWAAVLAEDARSDNGIFMVRDVMWNLVGRARQSTEIAHAFPGGPKLYTVGDPRRQPTLMRILQSRLRTVSSNRWTDETRDGWVADIEALRASFEAALAVHQPLEAAAIVAEAAYRTAAGSALVQLRNYKKDLQILGLTEPQIHEIIPDASPPGRRARDVEAPADASGAERAVAV